MLRKLIAITAWLCLLFIIYATLSSIDARPQLSSDEPAPVVYLEHFGAFAVLGLLFCLAYPRRFTFVCILVLGSAVLLEVLQIFIPDRDARVADALEKLAGGVAGILAARAFLALSWYRGWRA